MADLRRERATRRLPPLGTAAALHDPVGEHTPWVHTAIDRAAPLLTGAPLSQFGGGHFCACATGRTRGASHAARRVRLYLVTTRFAPRSVRALAVGPHRLRPAAIAAQQPAPCVRRLRTLGAVIG